ncbi:hypothetical protein JCM19232_416 [Vibrio ishigakensis]|uniref:Uncharacterized protein n=1 Tax=Vibrio ishigakensis TaxID=1481914 RepID=A0A0B8PA69_9VIBR|nr:hypothetical protein JCM19232_416 [Vibrio ishigakensis]
MAKLHQVIPVIHHGKQRVSAVLTSGKFIEIFYRYPAIE